MNTTTAILRPLDLNVSLAQAGSNLPAVTVDKPVVKKEITEAYTHFDIALRSVDTALAKESAKLGKDYTRDNNRNTALGWGLAAMTAGVTAAFAIGVGDWGWTAFFATGIPSLVGGIGGSFAWQNASERTPISQHAVQQLRTVTAGVPADSAEAVAIAAKAADWMETLKKREVHGPGAHDALQKLALAASGASPASEAQSERWLAVRVAAETLRTGNIQYRYDENDFAKAFGALPEDERRAIAPIVLEAIFNGERPRSAIGFPLASKVYALLRQTIDGEQTLALANAPQTFALADGTQADPEAVEKPGEIEHSTQALSVSANTLPAVSFACNVADLQSLLATFETKLTDVLADRQRFMRGTGAIDKAKIGRVLDMANDPARTTVERAFLAKRLERFGVELQDAQLYGYDARIALSRFVDGALQVPSEVLASARTLEAYFAATAPASKATLTEAQVSSILDALQALAPEQQKSAAQRAQSRYFDGEKSRGGTDYAAATRLGTGLLKYL